MSRTLVLSILFCFVALSFTQDVSNNDNEDRSKILPKSVKPEPTHRPFTTANPNTTTVVPTTNGTTVNPPPPTNATTIAPLPTNATTTTLAPITTNATTTSTTTPVPTNSTTTTTTTHSPTPSPITNGTTTQSPSTTHAPHPAPSDRKFDAFSFLGGFALALGLVAIGFLSWKFYQSRQENYYHTL